MENEIWGGECLFDLLKNAVDYILEIRSIFFSSFFHIVYGTNGSFPSAMAGVKIYFLLGKPERKEK